MDDVHQPELNLSQLLQIFGRRAVLIVSMAAVGCLFGILVCVFSPRRYEASGTIQIQQTSSDGLDRESLMGSASPQSDALGVDITLQTEASILQSNALALLTIHKLHLESNRSFLPPPRHTVARSSSRMDGWDPKSEQSPQQEAQALAVFHKALSVKPVPGTRLIEIHYTSSDPQLAAGVVNDLVQELLDYSFETQYKATEAASKSLSSQLDELRESSEKLQAKVADMQRVSGIYSIGTTDAQGREQAYSAILEQFQRSALTLSDAAQNRILKEAIYNSSKSGDAELLSSLAGNGGSGAAPSSVTNSLATIQTLRAQESTLQGQLSQLQRKFGSGYAKVAELEGSLEATREAIQQEVARVGKRAEKDYEVADRAYKNAQANYDQLKLQADTLNNRAIQYVITKQEADDSRSLYEDLLKRLKEVDVLQGLKTSTFTIVDKALVPIKPSSPRVPLYLAASLAAGALLGLIAAMWVEFQGDPLIDVSLLRAAGVTPAGILPIAPVNSGIEIIAHPASPYSDAVRDLRSTLSFRSNDQTPRVLAITSVLPGAVKSAVAANIAASAAQAGRQVLLVDADMCLGTLTTMLGLCRSEGLASVLSAASPDGISPYSALPGLFVLGCGAAVANPSALLESRRLEHLVSEWREVYDLVVIDSPSVLPPTDARRLSQMANATLLIAEMGHTRLGPLQHARQALLSRGGTLHLVLAGLNIKCRAYRDHHGITSTRRPSQGEKYEENSDNNLNVPRLYELPAFSDRESTHRARR